MKAKPVAALMMAGCLLAPLLAAADPDEDRSHPGQFVKDSAITTAVKTKLAADHVKSLTRIKVDTDRDGVVYLSGRVRSRDAAERAVQIARGTDGVRDVRSDIVVDKDAG
jgi:hyperosmotically inducible protein